MLFKKQMFISKEYWEKRYKSGKTSGVGSYGEIAKFKAKVINDFVNEYNIKSMIDFGCGDGNQLKYFDIHKYLGFDVSKQSIKMCINKFNEDPNKSFILYDTNYYFDNASFIKSDLVISLDVIYHLIEDDIYHLYMKNLFKASQMFVIIFSTNSNKQRNNQAIHIRNRKFTDWVKENCNEFQLFKKTENEFQNHKDYGGIPVEF